MPLTLDQLQGIFNQSFEQCPEINENSTRSEIPGWDSMSHLNLILNLEEATGHHFSMEEIESIKSVKDIFGILKPAAQ